MDHLTVAYCDDQAEAELILAGDAGNADDRKHHLDRAAVFAHCSEVARRDTAHQGVANAGAYRCTPKFRQATSLRIGRAVACLTAYWRTDLA